VLAIDDAGYNKLDPPLKVGDQVNEIFGVLDEAREAYRIHLLAPPQVNEASTIPLPQASPLPSPQMFRLATFNLANLFDTVDDPAINDPILSAPEYQRRLHKRALAIHDILREPESIAVQEAENQQVLEDLIAQPEIIAHYEIVWKNTSDTRGLDTALLYQTERIVIRAIYQEQACTTLIDGLGPDGNQDVYHPQNNITCDTNDDGVLDGNRLFSREPLIIFFEVLPTASQPVNDPIILIIAHFKSKVEDTPWQIYTLDRRTEEATYTAKLIQSYQAQYPQYAIILAGDLNDFPTSPPLQKLNASGLYNLTLNSPYSNRYSYVYRGISQTTDYILEMPAKPWQSSLIEPLHINADYPSDWATNKEKVNSPIGSSDHDLWQAIFQRTYYHYLPLILNKKR
ncbi:MAG: endonuclease/exonuclease/phosphatase family protein, partial [Anaerolineales bacterium]